MQEIETENLEWYLHKQKPHARAATIKLIYKWIPTYDFLQKQGRSSHFTLHTLCLLYVRRST